MYWQIPAGRPKGTRNKFTEQFFVDILAAWEAHGAEALVKVALDDPSTFVRVAAHLMAKDVNVAADGSGAFAKLWSLISNGTAGDLVDRLTIEAERIPERPFRAADH